ncbi:hypothetical protein [Deinococcus sp. UR1]|uniref:hypothetical protein n=1 Tax=Deinococcus sp. UR1 TaxID=1704277 RepID=UPI000C174E54|nr:hypothetical protein [Deinococcus sp. UR1]PIG96908.1 hypothetical protein AMD26_015395 [Deinococcus sp. UR1]
MTQIPTTPPFPSVSGIMGALYQNRERILMAALALANITVEELTAMPEADRPAMIFWQLSMTRTRVILLPTDGAWCVTWDEEWHAGGILVSTPTHSGPDDARKYRRMMN